MTALDTVLANSLELSTIGCSVSTTMDTIDDDSAKSTTVGCAITTILDSINIPEIYYVKEAFSCIEMMDEKQLNTAIDLIEERKPESSAPVYVKTKRLK